MKGVVLSMKGVVLRLMLVEKTGKTSERILEEVEFDCESEVDGRLQFDEADDFIKSNGEYDDDDGEDDE